MRRHKVAASLLLAKKLSVLDSCWEMESVFFFLKGDGLKFLRVQIDYIPVDGHTTGNTWAAQIRLNVFKKRT